jgi:hypothetical protein
MILSLMTIDGVTLPCKGLVKGLLNYGRLEWKFII